MLHSHHISKRVRKERHQTVKVSPSAAMVRATSLSPTCVRMPSACPAVGPRVSPPIAGTSRHACRTWRAGQDRADIANAEHASGACSLRAAATRDRIVWAVRTTDVCGGEVQTRCTSPVWMRRGPNAAARTPSMPPQPMVGLDRCRSVLLAIHDVAR